MTPARRNKRTQKRKHKERLVKLQTIKERNFSTAIKIEKPVFEIT